MPLLVKHALPQVDAQTGTSSCPTPGMTQNRCTKGKRGPALTTFKLVTAERKTL